jgi:anti-sigma B factor antagonist
VPKPPTPFEISCEAVQGARVVRVAGEVDIGTHDQLAEKICAEAQNGPVVVDLSACEFIDSSGVRALLLGLRATSGEDEGGPARFAIAGPNQQVRRILDMTGLGLKVPVHESVDEAIAALSG